MNFQSDRIIFSSVSSVGRATDTMDVEFSGGPFEIGFNSRFLLDALRACECDEVIMKFNGPAAAAVISPVEGDDFLYLVMPMRLS